MNCAAEKLADLVSFKGLSEDSPLGRRAGQTARFLLVIDGVNGTTGTSPPHFTQRKGDDKLTLLRQSDSQTDLHSFRASKPVMAMNPSLDIFTSPFSLAELIVRPG